ncbi:MAG: PhaM family polyhydroxyalkanoate granule multifunctional regulatory protein [Pseudomonadota bacterium]
MLKPQMPNIPGAAAVTDTLDFVKNLWGSMSVPGISIPGMAAPTMSVDELDKKIADLKAVESWLNLNLSMLRGTVQALEIQRGTIATLKTMGATLANAVKQPGANEKSVLAAAPYASAFFTQPPAEAKPEPKIEVKPAPAPVPPAEAPSPASAAMANPAIWWNMLQDQFKAAVTTALSSDAMAGATAKAQDAASKLGKVVVKAAAKPAPAAAPAKVARKRAPAKPKIK